jgi:hypothetical protein
MKNGSSAWAAASTRATASAANTCTLHPGAGPAPRSVCVGSSGGDSHSHSHSQATLPSHLYSPRRSGVLEQPAPQRAPSSWCRSYASTLAPVPFLPARVCWK